MSRRGLWIVPLLFGCLAAAAFVVLRLGGGSSIAGVRRTIRLFARTTVVSADADVAPEHLATTFSESEDVAVIAPRDVEADGPSIERAEDNARADIARIHAIYLASLLDANAEAHAATFLDEALAFPPQGVVLRGRAAIERAMLATFAAYRFDSAEMARLDVRLLGDTALEMGHYRYDVTSSDTGTEQTLSGRYAIVWKRHEKTWRIAFDTTQPGVFA